MKTSILHQPSIKSRLNWAVDRLIEKRNAEGYWTGRLSSSALATAVAIAAFKSKDAEAFEEQISAGLSWLYKHINSDGGLGDTPESVSNVSTSLLCYAAIFFCAEENSQDRNKCLAAIEMYLKEQRITLTSESVVSSVLEFYGRDYTFSVPILSMLTICGVIDRETFNRIPQLPFEFMVLPHSFYQFFNLQVVSYALPALAAVGIAIFKGKTKQNPLFAFIRKVAIKPVLEKLKQMLPKSGGFLEAIPLTAFVNLCLNQSQTDSPRVVNRGIRFLEQQQREDGSWPIDTDLSNWVTTLSIKAIGHEELENRLKQTEIKKLRRHLLSLQYKKTHPFNKAKPGGWGWTSFSGSVPDADDTSGAILALLSCCGQTKEEAEALIMGCLWLTSLQNKDGGMPTFSRGWGRLPFDSSCADISAHAFTAICSVLDVADEFITSDRRRRLYKSVYRLLKYMEKAQHDDGSWLPLWFGNQHSAGGKNPIYGTSKVVTGLADVLATEVFEFEPKARKRIISMLSRGKQFLVRQQNEDGSWGAVGSIEETALTISALATEDYKKECEKAFAWIDTKINADGISATPIGLYFASLWYDEELYPYIFYVEALRRYQEVQ